MNPEDLITKISTANLAYAKGTPFLTDTEYDALWQELHKYDPDNPVLYHTANNPTLGPNIRPHRRQFYGTNKAFNTEDLRPFMQRFGSEKLVLEPKYDGCAAIYYQGKDEHSDQLILEGDGITGRDISHHLDRIFFGFTPQSTEAVELIIPRAGWEPSFGANPRNTVSGWIAREQLPYLNLVEAVSHNNGSLRKEITFTDFESLEEILLEYYDKWSILYPLDGIMIKVLDETKRLISGNNGTTHDWSIAWKPPIQTAETTISDIEWNVSRTGRIIPTVIYDSIILCETTNSRATGNNAAWIQEKGLYIGARILVGKAGEIIPKIIKNISGHNSPKFSLPLVCPKCGGNINWQHKDLICTNENCFAKLLQRLEYFYSDKGMEVKTIGEHMIADLLEDDRIYSTLVEKPWALLDPIYYEIYDDIFTIWGNKRTHNYMSALNNIKAKKSPVHFIAALGFKGLAYKTALKIMFFVKYKKTFTHISKAAQQRFIDAYALYNHASSEIQNFQFDLIPELPDVTYCITGTLTQSRQDMISYLETYKWSFSNQVSKYTDFLIIGDNPGATKTTKAKELSIPTITESELTTKLKEK